MDDSIDSSVAFAYMCNTFHFHVITYTNRKQLINSAGAVRLVCSVKSHLLFIDVAPFPFPLSKINKLGLSFYKFLKHIVCHLSFSLCIGHNNILLHIFQMEMHLFAITTFMLSIVCLMLPTRQSSESTRALVWILTVLSRVMKWKSRKKCIFDAFHGCM